MFPKRGAFSVLITVLALVTLLGYRTPEMAPAAEPSGYVDGPTAQASAAALVVAEIPSYGPSSTAAGSSSDASGVVSPSATGSNAGASPSASAVATVLQRTQPPAATRAPGATPTPRQSSAPTRAGPNPTPTGTPTPAPAGRTGTSNGSVVGTPYGAVQVRVVYSNGKITDVVTVQSPSAASTSRAINARACPILRSEALSAQSAAVNTVSGATYTSNAYKTSLQYAIDHP